MQNDGPQDIEDYTVTTVGDSEQETSKNRVIVTGTFPQRLPAFQITDLAVHLSVTNRSAANISLALVVKSPTAVVPASIALQLKRLPNYWVYWIALAIGAIGAGIFALSVQLKKKCGWTDKVFTESTWSFGDVWVTTLSLGTTIVTGVLASNGFVDEVFQGVDTARFPGLSFIFAGAIALSVVIFGIGKRTVYADEGGDVEGPKLRLLTFSVSVLLFGAVGQLSILGIFTWYADSGLVEKGFLTLALLFAAFIIGFYSVKNVERISGKKASPPQTPEALKVEVTSLPAIQTGEPSRHA